MTVAIVVEDGTGMDDANSYATVAELKAYFDLRGFSYAGKTDDQLASALIQATDYIENKYRGKFKGKIEFPDTPQALSFPRLCLYDLNGVVVEGVPTRLKNATIEYAKRALTALLAPDPTTGDSGAYVASQTETIGPITESVTYANGGIPSITKAYPAADKYMVDYVASSSGVMRN